jgi:hypothetical protein
LWGFESAVGYSSLPIWRYLHLLWIANHGRVYPHAKLADDLTAQGLWTFESPIVDLLGVGWVLAPADRPIRARGFTKVFTGSDGIDVWRNEDAYPRGFVVYQAKVAPTDAEQAQAVAERSFRPSRMAIVDRPLPGVAAPRAGEEPPDPTPFFALTREMPEDLAIEVHARQPGVLVVGEAWAPGWKATLDGQPVEMLRVDYALRGVALPEGLHTVAMVYEDLPLGYGAAITLTAFSALIGLVLLARSRRRAAS